MRVVPEDLPKLFGHIRSAGTIARHTTESEDKTAVVIDVEAKLKNLTGFRDSLRAMLAKSSGTLKDIVEVQRQLVQTQSELDSLAMRRKVLANETEKVAVEVSFLAESSVARAGVFAPVASAFQDAGEAFAESLAALITFTVTLLPWLVLIVPVVWLCARLLRRLLRRPIRG